MQVSDADTRRDSRLAYKAYEIEELVDVYVFRRLGIVVAHAARCLRMSPNAVSVLAGGVGLVGGALLAFPNWAPAGVALLFLHGVIDSADGQLARLTGQVSELGRVLDGVSGYVTHVAVYLAIIAVGIRDGSGWPLAAVALVAGACTAAHAQLYDYHRSSYASIVLKRRAPNGPGPPLRGWLGALESLYSGSQRWLVGAHADVEAAIAARAVDRRVRDDDARAYRQRFYRLVCGWNLMGDNVRRYAIALAVALHHVEWFLIVTLVPLNLVFVTLWLLQQRTDRRYLRELA